MTAIFWLIDTVIGLAIFCLLANVIISWLVAFGIINSYQPLVRSLLEILERICTPILRPIRNFIPAVNGLDLSPLVALLALQFLRVFIMTDLRSLFY